MAFTLTKRAVDGIKICELYLHVLGRFYNRLVYITRPLSIVPFLCWSFITYISLILGKDIEDQPLVHNGFFPKKIYIVQCIERMLWMSAIIFGTNSWMWLLGYHLMLVSIDLIYMGWFISILLARFNPRLGQQAFTLYGIHDQDLAAIEVRAKQDLQIILLALQPWKPLPEHTTSNDKSEDEELDNIANDETINAIPSISNEKIDDSGEEDKEAEVPCLETQETVEENVPEPEAEAEPETEHYLDTQVKDTETEHYLEQEETETEPFIAEWEAEIDALAKYPETEDSYDFLHQHGFETVPFAEYPGSDYASEFDLGDQIHRNYRMRGSDYLQPQETETNHYLPQQVTETDHFVEQLGSDYAYHDFDLGGQNYVTMNQNLCQEIQLMRARMDDILVLNDEHETYWSTELTRISNSHEADRKNWEEEKQKIMQKLASSKSLVISGKELAREQKVRLLELEETNYDLFTKLCTATALSDVADRRLQEKVEKCSELDESRDDLLGKLYGMSARADLNERFLRVREEECKKLDKENNELKAKVEKISDEKMENFMKFEQEKSELKAKLSAALASSSLYCELLHDYGSGRGR